MNMLEDIRCQVHVIYGKLSGVCIHTLRTDDNNLYFTMLCEDDGGWFVSSDTISAFWLNDTRKVLRETDLWLKRNAIKGQWGWELFQGGSND